MVKGDRQIRTTRGILDAIHVDIIAGNSLRISRIAIEKGYKEIYGEPSYGSHGAEIGNLCNITPFLKHS